jgi:predicted TIM-barrel fold metal-dependent hydrolase
MEAVREVEWLVRDHGYRLVRFLAFDTQLPYDHSAYFPVYAKCCELGVPVGVNVGIPGPKLPGKHQHPLALDDVCYFFPELTIVMSHGGDPWADLCVKLMLKWDGLHYMSSAWAPRHIPKAIIQYLNTRGKSKVMWASDYPLLTLDRCTKELEELDLRSEEHRRAFVRDNALRLFFPDAVDD